MTVLYLPARSALCLLPQRTPWVTAEPHQITRCESPPHHLWNVRVCAIAFNSAQNRMLQLSSVLPTWFIQVMLPLTHLVFPFWKPREKSKKEKRVLFFPYVFKFTLLRLGTKPGCISQLETSLLSLDKNQSWTNLPINSGIAKAEEAIRSFLVPRWSSCCFSTCLEITTQPLPDFMNGKQFCPRASIYYS